VSGKAGILEIARFFCGFLTTNPPSLGSYGGQAHHGSEVSKSAEASKGGKAKCYTVHGIFVGKCLEIKEI
jgi:hypothetical protein